MPEESEESGGPIITCDGLYCPIPRRNISAIHTLIGDVREEEEEEEAVSLPPGRLVYTLEGLREMGRRAATILGLLPATFSSSSSSSSKFMPADSNPRSNLGQGLAIHALGPDLAEILGILPTLQDLSIWESPPVMAKALPPAVKKRRTGDAPYIEGTVF